MVKVWVTDPQVEGLGRNQFTTYLVTAEPGSTMVRRRYSDFQWLYGRLLIEVPGAVVPMIPHKRAMTTHQKLDADLVSERLHNLQTFMDKLVQNPELARAPCMTPFMLDKTGEEFEKGKELVASKHPAIPLMEVNQDNDNDGEGPGVASKAKQGISNFLAKARTLTKLGTGSVALLHTPEESQLDDMKAYIADLDTHIKAIFKCAEGLVQITETHANMIDQLGPPVGDWKTTYQNAERDNHAKETVLDTMSAVCEFSEDFRTLLKHKHDQEKQQFEYVLQGLMLDIKALKVAMKQRRQWQVTYTTKYHQMIDKEAAIAKARKALKPPEITDRLELERADLQATNQILKQKLWDCSARVLQEYQRMKPYLETTFQTAIHNYAKLQIQYTQQINTAYSQLLPYVDAAAQVIPPTEKEEEKDNQQQLDKQDEKNNGNSDGVVVPPLPTDAAAAPPQPSVAAPPVPPEAPPASAPPGPPEATAVAVVVDDEEEK